MKTIISKNLEKPDELIDIRFINENESKTEILEFSYPKCFLEIDSLGRANLVIPIDEIKDI